MSGRSCERAISKMTGAPAKRGGAARGYTQTLLRAAQWMSKYLNNIVEQDHRRVKQRVYPMPGFKNFRNAAITISGIELVQKIKKGQFNTSRVAIDTRVPVAHIWDMVIAA